jgi:hypothetical protein
MSNKIIETINIKNFNLPLFGNLLNQAISVTPQLMLEFNDDMLKSCSFSQTKSLIKLWTIPSKNLILNPKNNSVDILEDNLDLTKEISEFIPEKIPNFNFYILKGDLFKNYIGVFSGEVVDLSFNLIEVDGKKQASSIIIKGKSESGAPLETEFVLTTEELITNKISDFQEILNECTPAKDMFEFLLHSKQIIEIRGLIKKLHKSSVDNTAFLTFTVTENKIHIKDKVFSLEFDNDTSKNILNKNVVSEPLIFNVLKSDFILIGDHNFNIFTSNDTQKVIFGSKYGNSIIWCMSTKISENSFNQNDNDDDEIIDSLSVSQYLDDLDI